MTCKVAAAPPKAPVCHLLQQLAVVPVASSPSEERWTVVPGEHHLTGGRRLGIEREGAEVIEREETMRSVGPRR